MGGGGGEGRGRVGTGRGRGGGGEGGGTGGRAISVKKLMVSIVGCNSSPTHLSFIEETGHAATPSAYLQVVLKGWGFTRRNTFLRPQNQSTTWLERW